RHSTSTGSALALRAPLSRQGEVEVPGDPGRNRPVGLVARRLEADLARQLERLLVEAVAQSARDLAFGDRAVGADEHAHQHLALAAELARLGWVVLLVVVVADGLGHDLHRRQRHRLRPARAGRLGRRAAALALAGAARDARRRAAGIARM